MLEPEPRFCLWPQGRCQPWRALDPRREFPRLVAKSSDCLTARTGSGASLSLAYRDPQLFGSWWRGNFELADKSDGGLASVQLTRPFYLLHSRPEAPGISASTGQRGTPATAWARNSTPHGTEDRFELQGGLRRVCTTVGPRRRWLAGIRYEDSQLGRRPGDTARRAASAGPQAADALGRHLVHPGRLRHSAQPGPDRPHGGHRPVRSRAEGQLGLAPLRNWKRPRRVTFALSARRGVASARVARSSSAARSQAAGNLPGPATVSPDRRSPATTSASARMPRSLPRHAGRRRSCPRPRPPDRARWRQRAARLSAGATR